MDTYCILDLEIVKRLNIVEEYYSTEIAHILKKCLEYDMEVRCSL